MALQSPRWAVAMRQHFVIDDDDDASPNSATGPRPRSALDEESCDDQTSARLSNRSSLADRYAALDDLPTLYRLSEASVGAPPTEPLEQFRCGDDEAQLAAPPIDHLEQFLCDEDKEQSGPVVATETLLPTGDRLSDQVDDCDLAEPAVDLVTDSFWAKPVLRPTQDGQKVGEGFWQEFMKDWGFFCCRTHGRAAVQSTGFPELAGLTPVTAAEVAPAGIEVPKFVGEGHFPSTSEA